MKVKTLSELYKYIMIDNNKFEKLDNNCERVKNCVYEDEDFNEFLRDINTKIVDRTDTSITLSDGNITVVVKCKVQKNRFDYDLGDDTIFFFDTMKMVA